MKQITFNAVYTEKEYYERITKEKEKNIKEKIHDDFITDMFVCILFSIMIFLFLMDLILSILFADNIYSRIICAAIIIFIDLIVFVYNYIKSNKILKKYQTDSIEEKLATLSKMDICSSHIDNIKAFFSLKTKLIYNYNIDDSLFCSEPDFYIQYIDKDNIIKSESFNYTTIKHDPSIKEDVIINLDEKCNVLIIVK